MNNLGAWGTVVTIILAVLSSGTVVAIINWMSGWHVNRAEAENIWDQIKSRQITETDKKLKEVQRELRLCQYRVDRLSDGWTDTIEEAEKLLEKDFSASRKELLEIKYLDKIPGSQQPHSD